jgi:hypothetical protein
MSVNLKKATPAGTAVSTNVAPSAGAGAGAPAGMMAPAPSQPTVGGSLASASAGLNGSSGSGGMAFGSAGGLGASSFGGPALGSVPGPGGAFASVGNVAAGGAAAGGSEAAHPPYPEPPVLSNIIDPQVVEARGGALKMVSELENGVTVRQYFKGAFFRFCCRLCACASLANQDITHTPRFVSLSFFTFLAAANGNVIGQQALLRYSKARNTLDLTPAGGKSTDPAAVSIPVPALKQVRWLSGRVRAKIFFLRFSCCCFCLCQCSVCIWSHASSTCLGPYSPARLLCCAPVSFSWWWARPRPSCARPPPKGRSLPTASPSSAALQRCRTAPPPSKRRLARTPACCLFLFCARGSAST